MASRGGRHRRPGTADHCAEPRWAATANGLAVGAYIAAGYWFTSSTSFANPAVTLARMFSDTFAGIQPSSVPMFLLAQAAGAAVGYGLAIYPRQSTATSITEENQVNSSPQAIAATTAGQPGQPARRGDA